MGLSAVHAAESLTAFPLASLSLSVRRKVGADLQDIPSDARVVDATGKLVIPGEPVHQCRPSSQ